MKRRRLLGNEPQTLAARGRNAAFTPLRFTISVKVLVFPADAVLNTQTPNKLHSAIRNECSELVRFRLADKKCLELPQE